MDNFCGKRLDGRYEIMEIIGVGGMAVVYKAYDNIDDRIVAIKILKDEYLTNDEFKRRFKNESKAIAVLSHPNIVRVYNVSFGDRIQYIVMEYVDGITLKEYIEQQGAVNWKEAVHFMSQILAALQHAHDKGIVHQDIKPQNILLLQDGTIKVTDFGIARFSRADSNTTSEKAIGSVHYISPEQARGEVTDEKADIYSVGVVLYEMLTGQLPFQSDNAVSVAIMQLQKEPKRPREIISTIPMGLEQITMRAMQKSPNGRYGSAAEMLMDINVFKRNPSIKFDYSYFVDQEPTKYIRTNNLSGRDQRFTNDNNTVVEEKSSMNKTTAVMLGAIAGIVVLALVIGAILFGTKNQMVEVPNFSGFNYYSQIENEKKYTDIFTFEIEMVENSTLDDGTVISQDPISSTKVKKGSVITLTIAQKNSILLDTSIVGMTEEKAKSYLNQRGIISTIVTEYSETVTPGCVIKTSPEVGSTVKIGSEVTVYIATDTKETVKMPTIEGTTREIAEDYLKNLGLEPGVVTEVNSELEKGVVVQQSVKADTDVPVGSKIDFSVSNGILPESSVDVFVTLPSVNKTGILKIYINNALYFTSEELFLDGATKQFTLEGSGAENTYTITIDDSPVKKGTIDFTQDPVAITEEEITFDNKVVLINVEGMTEQEAIDKLTMAGFKKENIETVKKSSSTVPAGVVFSQVPTADGTTKFSTNESITLVVSSGPSATAN
ncbi:MAG: Stk1 family PASTA domain-containing Ser/Thr kinase [Clostridia bacterium]|nr:Stk1 family PASTA domain-containing Ser/Thr kinase [Clostridia bacterium]